MKKFKFHGFNIFYAKELQDWKKLKEKFKNEQFFDCQEGTINNKGQVHVKVALDQLKETSKDFFQIGALVKITDQTTKTEKGFYIPLGDLAVIMPKEKNLAYLAENRSPVKVGTGESKKTAKTGEGKATGIVTYRIYHDGKIEKHIPKTIKQEYKQKYKYVYHDKNNIQHDLGTFNYIKTTEMNKGNKIGNKQIELLDARQFKGYLSVDGNVKLRFLTWNSESKRWYINPECFAALLGAMATLNIDYLGFNGFSNNKAESVGGSRTHINGLKGDLRYLSTNKNGEKTLLEDSFFDYDKQKEFNDMLYNFGWGILEDMYSEKFMKNNKEVILPHTKHMKKLGVGGYRHNHHLHLSGFDSSTIIIVNE